jgi:hypothetical protein
LEVASPHLADISEFAVLDQSLRVPDRGDEPVVERGAGGDARRRRGVAHRRRLLKRRRERLLAEDGNAGLQRRDRRLRVDVVRPEVVEGVHLVERRLPVGRRVREAEPLRGVRERSLVAPDERVAFDLGRVREEHRKSRQRVRVRPAHESIPQYADLEWFSCHRSGPSLSGIARSPSPHSAQ